MQSTRAREGNVTLYQYMQSTIAQGDVTLYQTSKAVNQYSLRGETLYYTAELISDSHRRRSINNLRASIRSCKEEILKYRRVKNLGKS